MADQWPSEQLSPGLQCTTDSPPARQATAKPNPPPIPTTATPADSTTSDLYDTPWPSGTPTNNGQIDNEVHGNDGDFVEPPKPAALIPGLSLVNDKLTEQPIATNEPIITSSVTDSENMNVNTGALEVVHEENKIATTIGDVMDVEETIAEKPKEEVAQRDVNERTSNEKGVKTCSASQNLVEYEQRGRESVSAVGDSMVTEQTSVPKQEEANKTGEGGPANSTFTAGISAPENTDEAEEAEKRQDSPEWEVDSSPYESSSDYSSTDSSDDSDDSDDEDCPILSPEEQARILVQAELGSDDEGEGKSKTGTHIKSANEVLEEVQPIPDVTVTPDMKITPLGYATTVVDNAVLIETNTSGEYQVLESGSLLCLEDRSVVGVVCETLGRVEQPLYTVLYANNAEAEKRGITKGKLIYYVDSHSTFVFTQPLKGLKGSDASNFHDEEIGEEEIEFSDDEAEAEHKRKLNQKKQERKGYRNEQGGPSKGRKGPPGPSKLNQTELNYDDVPADDGYTPLARPRNLHELMGNQEAPVEDVEYSGRGSFRGGRGRGRGSGRGRGDRGRGRGGGSWQSREDRRPQQQYQQPSTMDFQPQPPLGYDQPAYPQNGQQPYASPQQFPPYAPYQPQPYAQAAPPAQLPFPMPYQPSNPYQQFPTGAHVNPLFFAALQQQQQQPQQQPLQPQQQQYQQPQQTPSQTMNFDQVKAQLDILRQLSNGTQGPRPT